MPNPEYEALERFVTADKRYRKFVYALTVFGFGILIWVAIVLTNSAVEKNRVAVAKAAGSNNAFLRTVLKENIRYNTCLLLVLPERRTAEVQQQCFKIADLPGGLTSDDLKDIVVPATPIGVSPSSSEGLSPFGVSERKTTSSSNNEPTSPPSQSNNSQQPNNSQQVTTTHVLPNCKVDIFFAHVGC